MVSSKRDDGGGSPLKFSAAVWLGLVVASLGVAFLAQASASGSTRVMAGTVTRLLEGDTTGRQALVGSAWRGIVPTLLAVPAGLVSDGGRRLLPFVWLHAFSVGVTWMMLLQFLRRRTGFTAAILLSASALLLPQFWELIAGNSGRGWALMFALYTALSVAEWAEESLLRYLVRAAFGAALLLLCGIDLALWLLLPLLILLVNPLCQKTLRRRWGALVMLGVVPALYGVGIWVLVNWLVMEDPLFFVHTIPGLWRGRELTLAVPGAAVFAVLGTALVGVVVGLALQSGRAVVLAAMSIAAVLLELLYDGLGLDWMASLPMLLAGLLAVLVIGEMLAALSARRPVVVIAFASVAMALSLLRTGNADGTLKGQRCTSPPPGSEVQDVAEYVRGITEHGRVFVLGYAGLGLLSDVEDDLFVSVLDLHVPVLRIDYYGQDLFLLVKRPRGRHSMDDVYWRHEDLYTYGIERAIFLKDSGEWRLFRIVTAPRRDPSKPPGVAER